MAFAARSRVEVEAFYRAALDAGGKDFGAPGVRAHYHPNYYGAFVIDHPARHGQDVPAFVRSMGLWWGELLTSLREHAAATREEAAERRSN